MKTPNFFLAGVAKAGTSSIHAQLIRHPQVSMPEAKELHFYCGCPDRLKRFPDERAYLEVFAAAPEAARVIGEASPCYLYYEGLMKDLAKRWPEAKILVTLRDPVDRFWSHYLMNQWYHEGYPEPHAIIDAWQSSAIPHNAVDDLVGAGLYGRQLSRLYAAFDPEQIMVTTLEDLTDEPDVVISRIYRFLELGRQSALGPVREKAYAAPRNQVSEAILRQPRLRRWAAEHVPARARHFVKYKILADTSRKPPPPANLVITLRELYRDDVVRTGEVVGRDLPWHHFPSITDS